jgi:hypothetical protein
MVRILTLFFALSFFTACAGGQKMSDFKFVGINKRAAGYVENGIGACHDMIEEAQSKRPDSRQFEYNFSNFQRRMKEAQKLDPQVLDYFKLYKGRTYKAWVDYCENQHERLSRQ